MDKIKVFPDAEAVEEICHFIDQYLGAKPSRNIDALGALVALLIIKGMELGIDKGMVLGYINNAWEVNDPENEHPLKGELPSFKC